eukprot:196185_1
MACGGIYGEPLATKLVPIENVDYYDFDQADKHEKELFQKTVIGGYVMENIPRYEFIMVDTLLEINTWNVVDELHKIAQKAASDQAYIKPEIFILPLCSYINAKVAIIDYRAKKLHLGFISEE